MVLPIDDHMVHRGHGVFDTAHLQGEGSLRVPFFFHAHNTVRQSVNQRVVFQQCHLLVHVYSVDVKPLHSGGTRAGYTVKDVGWRED